MKILLFITALLLSTLGHSQNTVKPPFAEYNKTDVKITSLTFLVNSGDELKSINWNDIKDIFKHNTNPKQEVELVFKFDLSESKNKIKGEFKIQGENKNIDDLISRAKKGVRGLIKIINKHKK